MSVASVLAAAGQTPPGWTLSDVWGLSNDGLTLAGLGFFSGRSSCWVASLVPSACYTNCDHSTTQPILNVQDFSCFLNAFAGGASYANCDQSTTPPSLNVADFTCFLNAFASGCP